MIVVLVGMMGSGKTAVGRALAQRTGWPYLDNDESVRAVTGREPEEIDATDGDGTLHEAESAALRRALAMPAPLIVGAAAGVVGDPAALSMLQRQPAVVYLRARPETLMARIGTGQGRRADAADAVWLRARAAERDATYLALASQTIDTDARDVDDIVHRIVEAIAPHVAR